MNRIIDVDEYHHIYEHDDEYFYPSFWSEIEERWLFYKKDNSPICCKTEQEARTYIIKDMEAGLNKLQTIIDSNGTTGWQKIQALCDFQELNHLLYQSDTKHERLESGEWVCRIEEKPYNEEAMASQIAFDRVNDVRHGRRETPEGELK